jgi:hypothetical protein
MSSPKTPAIHEHWKALRTLGVYVQVKCGLCSTMLSEFEELRDVGGGVVCVQCEEEYKEKGRQYEEQAARRCHPCGRG